MFTPDDLLALADEVAAAWRLVIHEDWSVPAGTLDWSCAKCADHAVDTVRPGDLSGLPRLDDYPEYGVSTLGEQAPPGRYVEAVTTAARVLSAVVRAAEPHARAVIWRRPRVQTRGPEDFAARSALERMLHAHDVWLGCRSRRPLRCAAGSVSTRDWPMWTAPGWTALSGGGDPWTVLLRASGRGSRSGCPQAGPHG